MKLHEQVEHIKSRAELKAFVEALKTDLQDKPGQWENGTLERFLGALASWIEDMDGYYRNHGRDVPITPSWRTIGEMLIAAKMYE